MVQQEWSLAEHLDLLVWQLRVSAQVDPGMVRVRRAPHLHDDHVAALWSVDLVEARRLVGLLVQAGPGGLLPPPILPGVGRELQPPLTLIPVRAGLPAVPGAVHEWPAQQRRAAAWGDGA
ncbi:hypothetical protein D3C77_517550 [compost metagenome]